MVKEPGNTVLRKLPNKKNVLAQQLDLAAWRNKIRDVAPGGRKPPLESPYCTKNTKSNVFAPTLINLKALKHVEFNKGSSIVHKTIQNQRCAFKQKPQSHRKRTNLVRIAWRAFIYAKQLLGRT